MNVSPWQPREVKFVGWSQIWSETKCRQLEQTSVETFDWIFFAIVLLPTAALVWDWLKHR